MTQESHKVDNVIDVEHSLAFNITHILQNKFLVCPLLSTSITIYNIYSQYIHPPLLLHVNL